eukprot:8856284-Pyramimonas_sp.AAC.1
MVEQHIRAFGHSSWWNNTSARAGATLDSCCAESESESESVMVAVMVTVKVAVTVKGGTIDAGRGRTSDSLLGFVVEAHVWVFGTRANKRGNVVEEAHLMLAISLRTT